LLKIEVEGVEGALGIAKAGELVSALEQTILTPVKFVRHEGGHEVDGRQLLGLGLAQASVQDRGHAGQSCRDGEQHAHRD
jgi:hypothetical protein